MKKIWSLMLLLLMVFTIIPPINAEEDEPLALIDIPCVLSDSEYAELSEALRDLKSTYSVDVAFVIIDEISGEDPQAVADDIYDYYGYGVGSSRDGILYLLCDFTNQYAFTTCGYGIEIFTDDGLEYIEEAMLPYLKDGNYYEAISVYIDKCEELIVMAESGEPYKKKINILYVIAGIILIPFALAFALMTKKMSKMNTAVMQKGAGDYMKSDSMNISDSRDIFIYSTVSKTERQQSDSSTHTSSSGTTHGGRSGSF